MPAAWIDLEAATQWPQHPDAVPGTHPGQHLGALARHPEMDGDVARDPVQRVDAERPTQHQTAVVGCPDVDELTGLCPGGEPGRVVSLEPLPGQELAALGELGV